MGTRTITMSHEELDALRRSSMVLKGHPASWRLLSVSDA